MPAILIEENRKYGIDCKNALWATDEIHNLYHSCGMSDILCDADFIVETEDSILLIEYKNANIPEAREHATAETEYNPSQPKKFNKIVSKYYDSLHFLRLKGKEKPIQYIFVVEYPKGDPVSRKLLRNRLKERLPFKLQERFDTGIKLIESVSVMNIVEWNADENYGRYPILPVDQLGT